MIFTVDNPLETIIPVVLMLVVPILFLNLIYHYSKERSVKYGKEKGRGRSEREEKAQ